MPCLVERVDTAKLIRVLLKNSNKGCVWGLYFPEHASDEASLIGARLEVTDLAHPPSWGVTYSGVVVKVVLPYVGMNKREVVKYTGLYPGDPGYDSIRGENCGVYRIILGIDKEDYVIIPVRAGKWKFIKEK